MRIVVVSSSKCISSVFDLHGARVGLLHRDLELIVLSLQLLRLGQCSRNRERGGQHSFTVSDPADHLCCVFLELTCGVKGQMLLILFRELYNFFWHLWYI